jgi:hypothetical protein
MRMKTHKQGCLLFSFAFRNKWMKPLQRKKNKYSKVQGRHSPYLKRMSIFGLATVQVQKPSIFGGIF